MIIATHEKRHIQEPAHTLRIPRTKPHLAFLQNTIVPASAVQGLHSHPSPRTRIQIFIHRCDSYRRTSLLHSSQHLPTNECPWRCLRVPYIGNKSKQPATRPTQNQHLRIEIKFDTSHPPLLRQLAERSWAQLPKTPSMAPRSDQTASLSSAANFRTTVTTSRRKTSQNYHHVEQTAPRVTNRRNFSPGIEIVRASLSGALRCAKSDNLHESNAGDDCVRLTGRFGVCEIGKNIVYTEIRTIGVECLHCESE